MTITFSLSARAEKESTYDRVIRTGEIRCGYFSWYPASLKDPSTGEIKGIAHDYIEALGKALNLKINWAEEIGLSDYPAALESGRIDAMCGIWPTAARSRVIDFAMPIYFQPLYAFARANDSRFTNVKDMSVLNNADYTMAVLEGGVTSIIRANIFPKTKPLEIPQLTSPAELFIDVAQNKADIAIYDLVTFHEFDEKNEGKLKQITKFPIKTFPNSIAVARGQEEFRRMIDNATIELLLSGTLDKIIDLYHVPANALYRVTKPYEAGK